MKKIFTLFVALGAITGVFAQRSNPYSDRGASRDVVITTSDRTVYNDNNSRYDGYSNPGGRDREIERVNRDFDARIRDIQFNRWMRPREKDFQIRTLQQQRRQQIEIIMDRYKHSRNWHDNDSRGRW